MPFSSYEIDPQVTIDDVHTALGEADGSAIPDETIRQKIEEEMLIVASHLPANLDELAIPKNAGEMDEADVISIREDGVEMLIRRRVARGSWHSSPTTVRKQALDMTVSYDIQSFRGRLNDNVEDAYDILGIPRGGSSAPFSDATGSAFKPRGKTHERY